MAYEWDVRKARRSFLVKFWALLLGTAVTCGLPIYIVFEAMRR